MPAGFLLAGGFGIMMAPTLVRATAMLISNNELPKELPKELVENGVTAADLSPERFEIAQ